MDSKEGQKTWGERIKPKFVKKTSSLAKKLRIGGKGGGVKRRGLLKENLPVKRFEK